VIRSRSTAEPLRGSYHAGLPQTKGVPPQQVPAVSHAWQRFPGERADLAVGMRGRPHGKRRMLPLALDFPVAEVGDGPDRIPGQVAQLRPGNLDDDQAVTGPGTGSSAPAQ
jgi:hypothetical protein